MKKKITQFRYLAVLYLYHTYSVRNFIYNTVIWSLYNLEVNSLNYIQIQ